MHLHRIVSVAPRARQLSRRAPPVLPWLLVAGLATAGATTGGCSYLLVDGPTAGRNPSDRPQCDRGRHWIVVDGLMAGMTVAAFFTDRDRYDRASYAIAITSIALHLAASTIGLRRTERCKDAFRAYDAVPNLRRANNARRRIERAETERLRIERARRRCDKPIAHWRAEQDFPKKAILFRDLDAECKELVSHRARSTSRVE